MIKKRDSVTKSVIKITMFCTHSLNKFLFTINVHIPKCTVLFEISSLIQWHSQGEADGAIAASWAIFILYVLFYDLNQN